MAQITVKGFISKIGEVEKVGKDKSVPMVKITVMDNTTQQPVPFQISFWRGMTKVLEKFRVGSNVFVKADVKDGSYDSKTLKNEKGEPKRIFGYNFYALEIVEYVDNGRVDLEDEMRRMKQASVSASAGCENCTPVDEPTPFDGK